MIPSDEAFFFDGAHGRLFGVWQPSEAAARGAVMFVHPFGEEKKSAHRAFVETARALAAQGVASLRFDLSGCGDSDGDFADATLEAWRADIVAAWAEMRRRAGAVSCSAVGLRLGAALATQAAAQLEGLHALILWQPMISGKSEFDTELRRVQVQEMITRGKAGSWTDMLAAFERGEREMDLDGYPITPSLYREIGGIDLTVLPAVAGARAGLPARCAIVQFTRPNARIESFAKGPPAIPSVVVPIPPIWPRTDFLPDRAAGELLAREGVLRWV